MLARRDAACASGGKVANGGSATLAVRGQRYENQGRPECTSDVEGRVDSHRGGSSMGGGGGDDFDGNFPVEGQLR
jgi:hypothetical protein